MDRKCGKVSVAAPSVRVTLALDEAPTTVIIQRYLDALPRDPAAEPVVRELLNSRLDDCACYAPRPFTKAIRGSHVRS